MVITVDVAVTFQDICPGSGYLFKAVSVEIRRVLSSVLVMCYYRYPLHGTLALTSSFVMGLPMAWNAPTLTFLAGFSLSLS